VTRLDATFEGLRAAGRKGLVSFITAGDPDPGHTVAMLHALVAGGVDVLELGVPFTDPLADGPVIQRASERALAHDVTLADVLDLVAEFRRDDPDTPVVLMGYANPVERMGVPRFAERAAASGVDGVLTVDVPGEEAGEWTAPLREHGLAPIALVAPTTRAERMPLVLGSAAGFVYYVSMAGVTGGEGLDVASVRSHVAPLREQTDLPIGVGFGVRDADSAAAVAAVADAVVVGSALIRTIEANLAEPDGLPERLRAQAADLRTGVDRARTGEETDS
jgi:tryptophan synthase alpha chain